MSGEVKQRRTLYLNYCGNLPMMMDAISDLKDQVDKVFIVNTTFKRLNLADPKIVEYLADEELTFQQSVNITLRHAFHTKSYYVWAHTDVRVNPGAVDALFRRLEEVKGSKWWAIFGLYDTLCLMNPEFFVQENYWGDSNLFPWYFSDNVRGMVAKLRGWTQFECPEAASLTTHLGSQTLKLDRRGLINAQTFNLHAQVYQKIMNGHPGHEKTIDPSFCGLFPVPTEKEKTRFVWTDENAPAYARL